MSWMHEADRFLSSAHVCDLSVKNAKTVSGWGPTVTRIQGEAERHRADAQIAATLALAEAVDGLKTELRTANTKDDRMLQVSRALDFLLAASVDDRIAPAGEGNES